MSRSTEPSTVSQITTEAQDAVPLIGGRSGEIGSEKMARDLSRKRGGPTLLTKADRRKLDRERAAERRRAIDSAPWRAASLRQLIRGEYDLPIAVVAVDERWRAKNELLPPDLSDAQIDELEDEIHGVELDMITAGKEATAVILHRLACCVILPDRDDDDNAISMQCYIEDLSGFPEHVLIDVTTECRRTQRFWPTIAELRKLCIEHDEGLGPNGAKLRTLYRFMAIAERPAPDLMVSSGWIRTIDETRDQMVRAFDRFKPQKRIESDKTPKLALAS